MVCSRFFTTSALAVGMTFVGCFSAHATVYLENLFPDGTSGMSIVQRDLSPSSWYATPFTTDGAAYNLNSVSAEISDFNRAGTLFMEVWSVDTALSYGPGAMLGRLQLVDDQTTVKLFETNILTGAINLAANTSYFLVTGVENGGGTWKENVNFADPFGKFFAVQSGSWTLQTNGPSGSTLQDSFHSTNSGSGWQSGSLLSAPLRMSMDASVVPEPSTWMLLGLGVFVFAFHSRRFWRCS